MIKVIKGVYNILINDVNVTSYVGDRILPNVTPDVDGSGKEIEYPKRSNSTSTW